MLGLSHKNVNTRVDMSDLRNHWITTKALITMFNILERKNKWCAPPMRYYGNLNVYFLECIGTHAVTLSVLVTKGHKFSLIHNILFCDQK